MSDQDFEKRKSLPEPTKAAVKRKPKPRPKRAGMYATKAKPAARKSGEVAAPKKAAIGVKDPWGASPVPVEHEARRREEDEEHEEHEESENPVATGLQYADYAHLGADAMIEGGTSGDGLLGLMDGIGEEASEVLAGEGTAAQTGLAASTGAIFAPMAITGGIMEMVDGYNEFGRDTAGGATTFLGGLATAGSGASAIAGLAGVGAAATAGPALASGAAGLKVGRYGNEQVKELGWLRDKDGNAEAPSTWAAENGENTEHWLAKHTHNETLAAIGGAGATALSVPVAGAVATAGAINGGVVKLENFGAERGKNLANFHRMNVYAGTNDEAELNSLDGLGVRDAHTGQVEIAQRGTQAAALAGQQMADYDDNLSDAVERSKVLHPERWGKEANELSAFNGIAEKMHEGTHRK